MVYESSKRTRGALHASFALAGALALGLSTPALAQDFDDDFEGDIEDDQFFGDFEPADDGFFGQTAFSASGEVDRVDLSEGRLVIDGRTYRADPRSLEGLRPGQHVSLLYEPIEDQAWISELQVDEGRFYGGDPFFGEPLY